MRGRSQSDRIEKKVFNVVRQIPVVGELYRLPRMLIYKEKGNREETMQSVTFDVNLLSRPTKLIKAIVDFEDDIDAGIWLGKRALNEGKALFGFTYVPGADLWHWALMINGTIYQLSEMDSHSNCIFKKSTSETTKNSFQWSKLSLKTSKSDQKVNQCFQEFTTGQKYKYSIVAVFDKKTMNCQTFVVQFLQRLGFSKKQLTSSLFF